MGEVGEGGFMAIVVSDLMTDGHGHKSPPPLKRTVTVIRKTFQVSRAKPCSPNVEPPICLITLYLLSELSLLIILY